jgi:hypothetical protein
MIDRRQFLKLVGIGGVALAAPARQAFSSMMRSLNPQGDKAIRFVKRLFREAGWLLRSDYPDDGVAA